jgi:hypothetical protein
MPAGGHAVKAPSTAGPPGTNLVDPHPIVSRSYKKPWITDQQPSRPGATTPSRSKAAKRSANRVVRQAEDVADGKAYRKESCSWSIRDWSFYCPEEPKAKRK